VQQKPCAYAEQRAMVVLERAAEANAAEQQWGNPRFYAFANPQRTANGIEGDPRVPPYVLPADKCEARRENAVAPRA